MSTVHAIGIDFGTANSCVAYGSYVDRGNGEVDPDPLHRSEVIPIHGQDTIPTAIHAGDGRHPVFGLPAEERAALEPQRFYTGFKLHLGRADTGPNAYLLTRHFFAYLRSRIKEFVPIDNPEPGDRIETIVGHPVQWNADQRELTLRAAQEAGFPNPSLEEESLAALYCHVFDERAGFKPKPGSHVLTIDMGGGTTDFAFLEIPKQPGQRPVSIPVHPTPEGGRTYGGRDLDLLLFSYLSRDWDPDVVKVHGRRLLYEVRRFKEAFSHGIADGSFEYQNVILVGDTPRRVRLTRYEFEHLGGDYIRYFEVLVREALKEAGLKAEQVAQLIVTGGHSRWYWVERTLGSVFPHLFVGQRTIFRHSHPEQSVARGLAYVPLSRSSRGGFLSPQRRAAHPVWLHVPSGARAGAGLTPIGQTRIAGTKESMLLISRGQLLPFRTQKPLRFQVEQVSADNQRTNVRIQFLSGQQRVPLAGRVATFERGFWEQVAKSLTRYLPWKQFEKPDRFEIQMHFQVDEHELITAEMAVTRFLGERAVDVQRQRMQINVEAALGRDTFGWDRGIA
jgi:Hsp70 protein